jgi:uncharacterized protein YrrD
MSRRHLATVRELIGGEVLAVDGKAGRVVDLTVDPVVWTVQYVVARRRRWLRVHDLFVPRDVIEEAGDRSLRVSVSRNSLRTDYEVVRPGLGVGSGGEATVDDGEASSSGEGLSNGCREPSVDLRSVRSLMGATVDARDEPAGRVTDMILNPATWIVLGMVVNTRGRLPGKSVLLPVQWVDGVDPAGHVRAPLERDVVRGAPPIDFRRPVTPDDVHGFTEYYSSASDR